MPASGPPFEVWQAPDDDGGGIAVSRHGAVGQDFHLGVVGRVDLAPIKGKGDHGLHPKHRSNAEAEPSRTGGAFETTNSLRLRMRIHASHFPLSLCVPHPKSAG